MSNETKFTGMGERVVRTAYIQKILCIFFLTLLFLIPDAIASPLINLTLPEDGNLTYENEITFRCNASSAKNLTIIELHADINGSFSIINSTSIAGFEKDHYTSLLCRFENSYECLDGKYGINSSTSFDYGRFMSGVLVNDSDTLKYSIPGILSLQKGTIEFWIKVGFNPSFGTYTIFDTGETISNRLEMQVSDGTLLFKLYDDDTGVSYSEIDTASWSEGEWHYIAAVWNKDTLPNGYVTDIFIDGSDAGADSYDDFYAVSSPEEFLFLGSDAIGGNSANSVFDELRISSRDRTSSEISASYSKANGNYLNYSAEFNVSGISDGIYTWNCRAYDNDSESSWSVSNFTLRIDSSSPPEVNSINISPVSDDDIDPGVTINVTANITSISPISDVVLQYKYDLDWINVTMSNTTAETWNASFTTIGTERIYYYRIIANDTFGHSNTSLTQSREVTWDYTWARIPANMTAACHVSSVCDVGIIAINNTGDDTLTITLADDWPIIDVYYNTTSQFSVPAKSVRYVNVTAKFAETDSSSTMTINISAQPAAPGETANPASSSVIVTMNSYTGGPYIDVTPDSWPSNVNQSQEINLSAIIKNIGNETAGNVTVIWMLPYGWNNLSGGTNQTMGDMIQQTTNRSSISLFINSSATSRIESICINVTRDPDVSYLTCQNIMVSCTSGDGVCGAGCAYTNDNDCLSYLPSGGSSSSPTPSFASFQASPQSYGISMASQLRVDGYRESEVYFMVYLYNMYERTYVNNISISVSGYPSSQVFVSPVAIDNLTKAGNQSFIVKINIPHYMKYGPYNLSLKAYGKARRTGYTDNFTDVSAESKVLLVVRSAGENDTMAIISSAEQGIEKMFAMGMETSRIDDMLTQAKSMMASFDYDGAKEAGEKIIEAQNSAFYADSLIKSVWEKLLRSERYGIQSNETRKMYDLAVSAFSRGDYDRAGERATSAIISYGIEAKDMTDIAEALEKNKIAIFAFASASLAFLIIAGKLVYSSRKRRRIKYLSREEDAVKSLIKGLQTRFFEKGVIGKAAYDYQTSLHIERLAKISKERASIESSRKLIPSSPGARKREIISRIKDAQKEYYEKRSISKELYESTLSELRKELADLEKNEKAGRKRLFLFSLLPLIIVALIFSSIAVSESPEESYAKALEAIQSAENGADEMQAAGFGIQRINDTISEAKLMLFQGKITGAISLAVYAGSIRDSAFAADDLIDEVEERIMDARNKGIDTAYAEQLFQRGIESFESEIYEDADDILRQALDETEKAEGELLARKSAESPGFSELIMKNREKILLFIIAASVFLSAVYIASGFWRKTMEIDGLKREKRAIEAAVKELQSRYFVEGKISKSEYELLMKTHRNRLDEIEKMMILSREKTAVKSGK